jgi:hypothetical protein
VKCFVYGKFEHKSYECPNRKKMVVKITFPKLKDGLLRWRMLRAEDP